MTRGAMKTACLALAALLALGGCTVTIHTGDEGVDRTSFKADRIKADVAFLADDRLGGRDTGSAGHEIAANYVAAQFTRLGLVPAGDDGGYFQNVPFQTAHITPDDVALSLTMGGETTDLTVGDEYLMSGSVRTADATVEGDVVFVGYGIHAPDLGHDDLAGVDLTGKIALVISGAPKSFQTEIRAHHGSGRTKTRALGARGAVGYITVNSAIDEKRRPFARSRRFLGRKSFNWVAPDSSDAGENGVRVTATVSHGVARRMFAAGGGDFDAVLAEADAGSPKARPLDVRASLSRKSRRSDTFTSPNVVALLEGTDPELAGEVVVMTAHLDHIGTNETLKGPDKINNGAMDNATGVSILMEVARVYAETGIRPRRSILFAAVTAEEKGLLGADYLARFPTRPDLRVVANVNVDMPVLLYDFVDVVAFGADRSTLGPMAAQALDKAGVTLSPDPIPEEGIFTRSDHYRFVQQGVPSVFLMTGWGESPDGEDGGALFREFLSKTYHTPRDDVSLPINYQAGAKFAYVNWLILTDVANADGIPVWNRGDFFGQAFSGPMAPAQAAP